MALVKNPPANAGDTGFIALKISHGVEQLSCVLRLWSLCSGACVLQLLSPALQLESPCSATGESLCSNEDPALSKVKTGEGTWDLLTCCPFCVFALLMKQ